MDISLQTALLGAVMGSAVLTFAMVYARALPGASAALGWWAMAFAAQTLGYLALIGPPWPGRLWASDALHGAMAVLVLVGALTFLGRRVSTVWLLLGLAAALVWGGVADLPRQFLSLHDDLPLYGLGGLPFLFTAWAFLRNRDGSKADGHTIAALAFTATALHEFSAPFVHSVPHLAPWSFVAAQVLAIVTAIALLVVVLRSQQIQAERETVRANRVQNQFLDAIESISEGFILFDSQDRLVLCNSRYREMLTPLTDLLVPGTPFREIAAAAAQRGVVPAAIGREEEWVAERMRLHKMPCAEEEQLLADGHWLLLRENCTSDGGTVGTRRDITERKRNERALRESEQRLRGIMDTVVDGIITIDQTGIVQSFNPAAERIFGYQAAEVLGRNVSMLMPHPHSRDHDDYLRRYLETGEARIIGLGRQVQGQRKDGTIFPLELAVSELRREGELTFIGVVRDITDRKRVEEALLESEQRFRDLAEAASDWFWETGPDLHFVFVSSRVRQVLGVKTAFFIGRSFHDFAEMSDEKKLWADHLRRLESHKPFRDFIFRQELPDGRIKYLKTSGRPLFDTSGAFRGYRGTGTDITAEVEAKATAERAQQQLAAAIESITEGFVLWDQDDRLVLCNDKYRHFFTHPGIEVRPGITFGDLCRQVVENRCIISIDASSPEKWLAERLRQHRQSSSSQEMQMADGVWVLANEHATPDGYVVGVYTDITGLKQREREIARQTERLQAIIDNMPQGISVFDRDMRLAALNERARNYFGLPEGFARPGETTFEDFIRLMAEKGEFGPGDTEELVRQRLDMARQDPPLLLETERCRPDGSYVEVQRAAMPDGGFLSTYTDITERIRTEQTLREAKEAAERGNRAKAAFLAAISHELRTPLNAIIGFSECMAAELFGPINNDNYRDYVRDIHDSGNHLLNLINDILDMSKAEAGKIDIHSGPLDLRDCVEAALRILRNRADNAHVKLAAHLAPDLPLLDADERRIKQILLNLLSNAIKFTEEDGMVTVSARLDPEGRMVVEIADTGIGMLPQDISAAMEPFAQIDSRLSRKYEGTGLGLPLTKALVEAHGGFMSLKSTFGQGTTAIVTFPASRVLHGDPVEA
ncbi:PAS-domain containing protein [Telmatospirillum sp. J64-1]|uniref:PAS-domain containing protein n=1 Tax=Telmatospirillum sp. J64-1 TaxID=2502183 RepID=UPI00115C6146|nr:PAS-domain containing protein [Telmatospirillum sp. J64-1]